MCTSLMISVPTTTGFVTPRTYVSSRCLEMPGILAQSLFVVPADDSFPLPVNGVRFVPPFVDSSNQHRWQNDFGFVGIASPPTGSAPPVFCDGLNTAGLSAGALWMAPGTDYPSSSATGPPEVSYLDFVAWLLGNFERVKHVRRTLERGEVSIVGPPALAPPPTTPPVPPPLLPPTPDRWYSPLHFIVTDSTGASIVVEFVNGQTTIYDSPNGVLTNAPTYDWHRTNVDNYFNLTLLGQSTSPAGTVNPVGGGLVGLPGDSLPSSRFVRAWLLSGGFNGDGGLQPPAIGAGLGQLPPDGTGWLPAPGQPPTDAKPALPPSYSDAEQTAVTVAMQLVQICMGTPYGMLLEPVPKSTDPAYTTTYGDYTIWTSVRDHTNLKYYAVSAFSAILTRIGLSECEHAPPYDKGWLTLPVMPAQAGADWAVNGNPVSVMPPSATTPATLD